MKQLKNLYFDECLEDAKNMVSFAMKTKNWTAKAMSFKRAAQAIKLAGKTLNEIYMQERRCKDNEILENNRTN